jgi:hypothetical protein
VGGEIPQGQLLESPVGAGADGVDQGLVGRDEPLEHVHEHLLVAALGGLNDPLRIGQVAGQRQLDQGVSLPASSARSTYSACNGMGRQMSTRNDWSSNAASMVVEWSNPNCAAAVAVLSGSRPNITTSTSPRAAYAAAWAWPNPVPNRAIFMIIVPFELDGYMVRSVRSSAATEGVDLGDIGGAQSDLEGVVILRDPIGVN